MDAFAYELPAINNKSYIKELIGVLCKFGVDRRVQLGNVLCNLHRIWMHLLMNYPQLITNHT